jgi:beta-galactosidase
MKAFGLVLLTVVPIFMSAFAQQPVHTFGFKDSNFLLDGKPIVLISGEMHFARVPREYWRDRFRMAKAMGLNTIATYIFWNYHEPEKGKFNFSGNADVAEFVRIAQEEGLWIIIRPSPYACAEWEFGGYPWWLINEKEMKVRSRDPRFLELSKRYFGELARQLVPLQITRGGNIIMVQLENEYGSYDSDKEYLTLNKNIIRESGFDVELYTCDGPSQMPAGYLPGLLPAVNGLDDVKLVRELINKHHNGAGPYFIAEWYPAWFDTWGVAHHVVPAEAYVKTLDEVLENGISINMYMVHGGTSRGFMNGANFDRTVPYSPQITSYDYDAPIDEAGNATPKYMAFREVIQKHLSPGAVLPPVPPAKRTIAIPRFTLQESAGLLSNLPAPTVADRPLSFEDLHQGYGYVLYRTQLKGPLKGTLQIDRLRDYALVAVNGKRVAVLDRRLNQDSVEVDIPAGDVTLDLFVENLGRVNYGPFLNDNRKGITERVTLNGQELKGWNMYGFPFNDVSGLTLANAGRHSGPVIRRGTFSIEDTADTYLDMRDWGKGSVWLNGHSIGRYWYVGPQQTLYVPGPWLRKGRNEVVILELLQEDQDQLQSIQTPILDELAAPTVSIQGRYDVARQACILQMLTKNPDAAIYYTTDGSDPTARSLRYDAELSFNTPTTVAARAFRKGIASDIVARVEVSPSLSSGRPVALAHPFSDRYPAGGPNALADGLKGSRDFKDGFWQGYEGSDLEAIIDLGQVRKISRLSSRFMQDTRMWIFYPRSVEYAVSSDGATFAPAGTSEQPVAESHQDLSTKEFGNQLQDVSARYIRVRASSIGVCPPWHAGAGGKPWMFCDEITAE